MTNNAIFRHDISDKAWGLIENHLPGRKGVWGGKAHDNRRFFNGVLWLLRTGAPVRDLPSEYGNWATVHRRFLRWRDKGIWEELLEKILDMTEFEWLIIDATHCKAHQHAAGAIGGNQAIARTKGGSTPRYTLPFLKLVCRSEQLSQKAQEMIARKLSS